MSNVPVHVASPVKPSAQIHSGSPLKFWHTLFPVQGGSQTSSAMAENRKKMKGNRSFN